MKYYLDLEFHEYQRKVKFMGITIAKVWTIDLISIGIVNETGKTFYAINKDMRMKDIKKNKWLMENVMSKLPEPNVSHPAMGGSPRCWEEAKAWRTMDEIKYDIIQYLGGQDMMDESGCYWHFADKPEFYAYYADYDWVRFCWIFGTMMQLPNGFPMYCKDLKQMLDAKLEGMHLELNPELVVTRSMNLEEKLERFKRMMEVNGPSNEHHALADAKWNKRLHDEIINLKQL